MRRTFSLIAPVLALISCRQEHPALPIDATAAVSQYAHKAAGADAVDCGIATDEQKWRAVYDCAGKSFAADEPFVAVFVRPEETGTVVGDRAGIIGWASPATALFSTGDGSLHSVDTGPGGTTSSGIMFARNRDVAPLRVGGLVRPAVPIGGGATMEGATAKINGLVILECRISSAGTVQKATVMKALAGNSSELAQQLVRGVQFRPGTVLGQPVPVVQNISLQVLDGRIRIIRPDSELHGEPQGPAVTASSS